MEREDKGKVEGNFKALLRAVTAIVEESAASGGEIITADWWRKAPEGLAREHTTAAAAPARGSAQRNYASSLPSARDNEQRAGRLLASKQSVRLNRHICAHAWPVGGGGAPFSWRAHPVVSVIDDAAREGFYREHKPAGNVSAGGVWGGGDYSPRLLIYD